MERWSFASKTCGLFGAGASARQESARSRGRMGGVAGRQDNDRENDELVFVVFIPAPLDEPIPGAHFVQSRPNIRLRVGTGVLRAEFRPG